MSRDDHGVFGERAERIERTHQRRHVAAGEVGTSDGAGEKRVAGKQQFLLREEIADAAGGVAGCRDDRE